MRSIRRITTLSIRPPTYPAISPSGTPTKRASTTEDTPTTSDTRLPWMTRLSMSRPSWSVPSG